MRSGALNRITLLSLGSLLTLTVQVAAQELDVPAGQAPGVLTPPTSGTPVLDAPAASTPAAAAADTPRERRHRRRNEESAARDEGGERESAKGSEPEEQHQVRPFATSNHNPRTHHTVHLMKAKPKKVAGQAARGTASQHKKKHAGKKKHHKKKKKHHKGM